MALPIAAVTAFVNYTLGTPIGMGSIVQGVNDYVFNVKKTITDGFISSINTNNRWGEFFNSEPTIKVFMLGEEKTWDKNDASNLINSLYPGFLEKVKNLLATQEQQQAIVVQQQQQQVIVAKNQKNYLVLAAIFVGLFLIFKILK